MLSFTLAALFSRNVSQVLIAIIGAATAIGGPVVTFMFHRRLGGIQVSVNGRLDALLKAQAENEAEINRLKAASGVR